MKTTFLKPAFFAVVAATVLSACVQDDDYGVPSLDCTETSLVATMDAADVPAGAVLAQYTEDDVIEAYVTSSDEGGNFFKTISFQTLDGSFAFSVPVDATSTFISFQPGRKVFIKLQNLYTDRYQEGVRIGTIFLSGSVAAVGRLSISQYRQALVRSCDIVDEDELVQQVSLEDVQDDSYINKLVEIDNVQFSDAAVGEHYYEAGNAIGGATNHLLEDENGNSLVFRTSSFANFASAIVPSGRGKVRGVLTKFNGVYQFLARTQEDIQLTQPRIVAFYSEDFQEAVDNTNFNIAGWVNFAEAGTRLWREEAFSGNGYAEFSAFGSGNTSNVNWLISPAIDFTPYTNKSISFKVAQHHLDVDSPGNSLEVLVSTDFDGTNVLAATWTPINATLPTSATPWYEFVGSMIDVSNLSGNVYVAFKFRGSGTDLTLDGAFQVDDLKAYGQ